MNGRIQKKFIELKKRKQKALILFMTAGDPSLKKNEALITAFENEGADIIELGVPFSDPLADGPVIQGSSQRALKKNTTLQKILDLVARARKKSQVPLVLMSYLNPILHYGIRRFAHQAHRVGVDGVIIPDLPPDEGKEISAEFKGQNLSLIYLLAPTSSAARRNSIARQSRGFMYYVSMTGVTGTHSVFSKKAHENLLAAKKNCPIPVCVGFGVSTPKAARAMAKLSDGVIIGSAVVRGLEKYPALSASVFAKKIIRPFAKAIGKGI